MFAFKWFSLFPPPTSLKKKKKKVGIISQITALITSNHSPNNFILLGSINTWSWLIDCLLKPCRRRWWSTCSTFRTLRGLHLPINNSFIATELNLFVLVCFEANLLHFFRMVTSQFSGFKDRFLPWQIPNSYSKPLEHSSPMKTLIFVRKHFEILC